MKEFTDINPVERQKRAEMLFMEGYNCCQAVLLAFEDLLEADRVTLLRMSSGFGGGIARLLGHAKTDTTERKYVKYRMDLLSAAVM